MLLINNKWHINNSWLNLPVESGGSIPGKLKIVQKLSSGPMSEQPVKISVWLRCFKQPIKWVFDSDNEISVWISQSKHHSNNYQCIHIIRINNFILDVFRIWSKVEVNIIDFFLNYFKTLFFIDCVLYIHVYNTQLLTERTADWCTCSISLFRTLQFTVCCLFLPILIH